ncbi:MAG: ABC transporter ATP-binding protein [Eubacterium sp.]|nr:ABC transporter ATP-binding protein [Eubacterium sp.]
MKDRQEKSNKRKTEKNKYPLSRMGWLWENTRGVHGIYMAAIVGTVLYNIMQLTVPFISGKLIDTFLTGEKAAENLTLKKDLFYTLLIAMVGLTILRVIIVYADCMAYEYVSQKTLFRIRNFLFDKIQRQDMTFFSTYRTGDLMTRVTGDLDAVRHMIAWVVRVLIECFALFGAAAIYFFVINWKMALALLAIAPFVFIVIVKFKKAVSVKHTELRERLAEMNTVAQENISGNRVVKAFAREENEIEKFDKANVAYRDTNKQTGLVWIKFYPYVESFANLMPLTMLLVGGLFLIHGGLTMGEYVAISGLIWAITNPMRMMGNIMNEFQRFRAASDKVMEIYYSEPEIKDAEGAVEVNGRLEGDIVFDHVSFQYPDGKYPVLHDISFTVKSGETVAIMGETGCGKTSLIQLIPRFFETTGGEIRIDGIPVEKYRLEGLRKNIGFATQDVLLYSDSIEGNIAYGDPHIRKREVVRFARYSAADDFISRMPEGYETIVGERGVGLSGGQKQRLSLARALAVRPSILILDDTTSAVDLETERQIQESLRNLDFKATKLIIAQRVSTAKTADRIIILKDGRILEEGSHAELAASGGYYSELVQLQEGL